MREGDKVKVGSLTGNVIETPGHTLGHIVYWFHADNIVFAADTLFSIGCGRVIEGTHGPDVGLDAEDARPARRDEDFLRS